jgi:hypothetical protein
VPVRIFLPGIIWFVMMILIIGSPLSVKPLIYFDCVPSRSFVQFFLYLGFVHVWLGVCKKQLKYEVLRERAFPIVFGVSLLLAVFSETILYTSGVLNYFSLWNLGFDIGGALFGLLTFRLLYRSCY